MKINQFLISLFFSTLIYGPIQAQSAEALLQNMDFLIAAPKDKEANVLMIIKDKNGTVKEREATLKQKGKYKKLYRYTKPEKQAGIATLSLPDAARAIRMATAFASPPARAKRTISLQGFIATNLSAKYTSSGQLSVLIFPFVTVSSTA